METVPYHPLIIVTAEDVKKVRELCGIDDPNRIKEGLDKVYEWCQKEDHLVEACKHMKVPSAFDIYSIRCATANVVWNPVNLQEYYVIAIFLERVFILARGSVEGTKKRIDSLLTSRGMIPELSLNQTFDEFKNLLDCVNYVPLPKVCPVDQSRVIVTQFLTDKLDDFTMLGYFRYSFMIGEYRLSFDYGVSERYVIDLANVNLSLLSKVNPILMKKAEVLATEGLGTKIKGIHILNAPSFVDKFVFILKQALREKVASRIHVHGTFEDFHKHIPKEILPRDYGGDEQSCSKLAALWKDTLKTEEAKKIIDQYDKLVSDETKRDSSKFNEEIMGMPGSFRMLTID